MGARDGACVDATGLASGKNPALWTWPDQDAHEGKKGVRARLWRYISSKSAQLMFIGTTGVLVQPRRRCYNFLTCPEGATWMASAACSEACLVL